MSLFYIYFVLVGFAVCGIGYVIWLMNSESNPSKMSLVEKLSPEDLRQFNVGGKAVHSKAKTPPISRTPLSVSQVQQNKQKPLNNHQVLPNNKKNISTPKANDKNTFINKLFGKNPPKGLDDRLLTSKLNAADSKNNDQRKPKGFMDKLTTKLSFGKKRVNPLDDIPQATTFASLTKKTPELANTKKNDPLSSVKNHDDAEPSTGTASLKTTHYNETGQKDEPAAQREKESTAQLDEWKKKYEKLESLFNEKSQKLKKAEDTLSTELKNRDDFFKLKALLESEIKEVKDRARELQLSLKNARMETEQQKIQADQLKDKTADLEEAIQAKNVEIERMKKPESFPIDTQDLNSDKQS